MPVEAVIGLEVHAELATRTKMFCGCRVVDSSTAAPNTAVCPVCSGMPGVLPVANRQAVELGLRVALALECQAARVSIFARKNYFYPDLPKGYQISQYEQPLALGGRLVIDTPQGERTIRIRRVHLEEDTGKLTHVHRDEEDFSLVDLNRAGLPLLEIVSEPDLRSVEEARAYALALREILRCVGASSGDMEKGAVRFEANISVRPAGSDALNTRVEIKNLNSFHSMERALSFEIERQSVRLLAGLPVEQETVGWDETAGKTFSQRSKEEAHDYRYFPEPDLPPLVVDEGWEAAVAAALPELPRARARRLAAQYDLPPADARTLAADAAVAVFFEETMRLAPGAPPRSAANLITGEIFGWLNQSGQAFEALRVSPAALAELVVLTDKGQVNLPTAKSVLGGMLQKGGRAGEIIAAAGLHQISNAEEIQALIRQVLGANPGELASYLAGKETLSQWFFGQVMRLAGGKANPAVVRQELQRQLEAAKAAPPPV